VLHLLYARFYTKVLRDLGLTKIDEPFMALLSQGMVIKDGAKMSKSKGNVVSDDFVREKYGADTGRLFELFAAPPEKDLEWNDQGIEGASRFLNRVWRFVMAHRSELGGGEAPPPSAPPDRSRAATLPTAATVPTAVPVTVPTTELGRAFRRTIHETIQRVTDDIEREFHFNTAIAAIMELVNALQAFEAASGDGAAASADRAALMREAVETTLHLLGPFCPHVTEELWEQLGHRESLFKQRWPVADPAALQKTQVTVVVQVDGKVRGRLQVGVDAADEQVRQLALGDDRVRPWVERRSVEKVVVVPNRLVNIVTRA
jgi:leucyl-tRNA synthetase